MKTLRLIVVSGRPPAWATEAEINYCRQLRHFTLAITTIRPSDKDKEATAVLAKLPTATRVVLLDVGGNSPNSTQFAAALSGWLQHSSVALVIAGADGPGKALTRRADETLSLSPLTFPHALARVVLVEQLFRADCTLRRHPYPR